MDLADPCVPSAGPAFAQDPLPDSAESQSARNEVNKETSEAPGLGSIGKNLFSNLGGGGGESPLSGYALGLWAGFCRL